MSNDDYGHTLGVGTISYETTAPKTQPAPRTYTVKLLVNGRVHDTYRVDSLSVKGDPATVHHHRKSGNLGCMSCHTANQCPHSAAVREWLDDQAKVAA